MLAQLWNHLRARTNYWLLTAQIRTQILASLTTYVSLDHSLISGSNGDKSSRDAQTSRLEDGADLYNPSCSFPGNDKHSRKRSDVSARGSEGLAAAWIEPHMMSVAGAS